MMYKDKITNIKEDLKKQEIFCLPPPNVNGSLHIGHAINNFLIGYFAGVAVLKNNKPIIIPGTDHGGISTQVSCFKNQVYKNLSFEEKSKVIEEFALECQKKIKQQLNLFDLNFDWEKEAYTLDKYHYDLVIDTFINFYNKGLIKRENLLVNWVPSLKTTISDLEIEYKETEGILYTIPYQLKNGEFIEVATTKPETIFADVALAINPNDKRYTHLIGSYAYIPIINKEIPIISSTDVEIDFGTGVLKITPTLCFQDFHIAQKEKLKFEDKNLIDENGLFDFNLETKLTEKEAREYILSKLQNVKQVKIQQKIPIHDKTGSKVINFLKPEWILKISNIGNTIKEKLIPNFIPSFYRDDYNRWLSILKDWCISRQLAWGHRLPVYYNQKGDYIVSKTPIEGYHQTQEHLDTWFSSALWFLSVLKRNNINEKVSMFVTGKDIIFFWVARIVICHELLELPIPFENVFIHGLVRDKNNKKMSKSQGNVEDPIKYIEKYGINIFKFCLLRKYREKTDVLFSEDDIFEGRSIISKLENFYIFMEKHNLNKISLKDLNIDINNKYIIDLKNFIKSIDFNKIYEYIDNLSKFLYTTTNTLLENYKTDQSLKDILVLNYYSIIAMFSPLINVDNHFNVVKNLKINFWQIQDSKFEVLNYL